MLGRWLLPGIIIGSGLQSDLTNSLTMKSIGHSLHYKEWIGIQCLSVSWFGAIPLIHCLTSGVGRLFTKGHIINILDFADHRSLFQLLDFAAVTRKQLETACK